MIRDYIRLMGEMEQTYLLRQTWRNALYSLKVRMIDHQAALIKSQNDPHRDFERNFRLSENFLKLREEFQAAETLYETISQRFGADLDRVDTTRMLEIEQASNRLLLQYVDTQQEVMLTTDGRG